MWGSPCHWLGAAGASQHRSEITISSLNNLSSLVIIQLAPAQPCDGSQAWLLSGRWRQARPPSLPFPAFFLWPGRNWGLLGCALALYWASLLLPGLPWGRGW